MNFKLRPFTFDDITSVVVYGNNKQIAQYMMDTFPNPYYETNAHKFIEMTMNESPIRIFAIDINDEAVGAIGIHPQQDIFRKNAELGYWLGQSFWGKGVMTAAINQMIVYGFTHFDITRIFARPFSNNPGSQRVLEKTGFKLEARLEKTILKNGEYLDELIYSIRK